MRKIFLAMVVSLVIISTIYLILNHDSNVNLRGTITSYSDATGLDGPLNIEVDKKPVYLGNPWVGIPEEYFELKIGDQIEAHVEKDKNGRYTVDCDGCFIRKQ